MKNIILNVTCLQCLFYLLLQAPKFAQLKQIYRLPDGTRIYPNGTRRLPDGIVKDSVGRPVKIGTKLPDGSVIYPNGKSYPDYPVYSNVELNSRSKTSKSRRVDGCTVYPDGKIVYADGSVRFSNGRIKYTDGTLRYPNGAIKNSSPPNSLWAPTKHTKRFDKLHDEKYNNKNAVDKTGEVLTDHGNGRDYPSGVKRREDVHKDNKQEKR